jgi:hypothetical protein
LLTFIANINNAANPRATNKPTPISTVLLYIVFAQFKASAWPV